jgi:hypothetical protein
MRKNEEKQGENITLNIKALEGFAGIFEILRWFKNSPFLLKRG